MGGSSLVPSPDQWGFVGARGHENSGGREGLLSAQGRRPAGINGDSRERPWPALKPRCVRFRRTGSQARGAPAAGTHPLLTGVLPEHSPTRAHMHTHPDSTAAGAHGLSTRLGVHTPPHPHRHVLRTRRCKPRLLPASSYTSSSKWVVGTGPEAIPPFCDGCTDSCAQQGSGRYCPLLTGSRPSRSPRGQRRVTQEQKQQDAGRGPGLLAQAPVLPGHFWAPDTCARVVGAGAPRASSFEGTV